MLDKLPYDILRTILLYDMPEDPTTVEFEGLSNLARRRTFSFSCVSTHTRAAALSTPTAWVYLDNVYMHLDALTAALERSGSCVLHIVYGSQRRQHRYANSIQVHEFLGQIYPHAHRWGSLTKLGDGDGDAGLDASTITWAAEGRISQASGVELSSQPLPVSLMPRFPALTTAVIHHTGRSLFADRGRTISLPALHTLVINIMAFRHSLRNMEGEDSEDSLAYTGLTTLYFINRPEWQYNHTDRDWITFTLVERLLSWLPQTSGPRKITVPVRDIWKPIDVISPTRVTPFHKLTTLHLDLSFERCFLSPASFWEHISPLPTPSLRHLFLTFDKDLDDSGYFSNRPTAPPSFQLLLTLGIFKSGLSTKRTWGKTQSDSLPISFGTFFDVFPQINHVLLDNFALEDAADFHPCSLNPHLTNVYLNRCTGVAAPFLRGLLKRTNEPTNGEGAKGDLRRRDWYRFLEVGIRDDGDADEDLRACISELEALAPGFVKALPPDQDTGLVFDKLFWAA